MAQSQGLDLLVRVICHLKDWVIVTVSWLFYHSLGHIVNRILEALVLFSFCSLLGIIWFGFKPTDSPDTVVYGGVEHHSLKRELHKAIRQSNFHFFFHWFSLHYTFLRIDCTILHFPPTQNGLKWEGGNVAIFLTLTAQKAFSFSEDII